MNNITKRFLILEDCPYNKSPVFTTEDKKCQSVCEITVESTMSRNAKKQRGLSRTAFCVIVAFVLQFLPGLLGRCGSIIVGMSTVVSGMGGIIKYKDNIFWNILLMLFAVCIIIVNVLVMLG